MISDGDDDEDDEDCEDEKDQGEGDGADADEASEAEAERVFELFEGQEENNPDAAVARGEADVGPEPAEVAEVVVDEPAEGLGPAQLAEGEEPRRPRRVNAEEALGLAVVRRPGLPEECYNFHGNLGQIRYSTTQDVFRAVCPRHGDDCHRQRAAFEGRGGQGRPLGGLYRWLQRAEDCATRQQHMKLGMDSYNNRLAARHELLRLPGIDRLTQHERKQNETTGEGIEPLSLP